MNIFFWGGVTTLYSKKSNILYWLCMFYMLSMLYVNLAILAWFQIFFGMFPSFHIFYYSGPVVVGLRLGFVIFIFVVFLSKS